MKTIVLANAKGCTGKTTVADLLGRGQSIEEVEPEFAPTMHPVDWATVRSIALAQVTRRR